MARPTSLRVLGERAVPAEEDPDLRPVAAAFPRNGAADPYAPHPELNEEDRAILAVIRQSQDRLRGEIASATAVASEALNRADAAGQLASGFEERAAAVEGRVEAVGHAAMSALAEHAGAVQQAKDRGIAAATSLLHRFSSFAFDRLPALFAIGSAFWLWESILQKPETMQLAALGLYGLCVIGPAVWLSVRNR